MTRPCPIHFFLAPKICDQMRYGGGHPFFSIAKAAFADLGHPIEFHFATEDALIGSANLPGYSLFHYKDSLHDKALDVRRIGIGPFYRMERARYRAGYRMTEKVFDPSALDQQPAQSFFRIWERLAAPPPVSPAFHDHVLVALQGRLTSHRRGQSMSPIDMIHTTLRHEPTRQIVLKLHPKETYTSAERAALNAVLQDPRVHLFEGDLADVLATCAYVVAQNSSVLLKGVLYRKPGIVFADCEFHHPFQSLRRGLSAAQAFANVMAEPPSFEKFAYWFLQCESINTSRDWAPEQIIAHAREFGWAI